MAAEQGRISIGAAAPNANQATTDFGLNDECAAARSRAGKEKPAVRKEAAGLDLVCGIAPGGTQNLRVIVRRKFVGVPT